jgi:hypothetical protein
MPAVLALSWHSSEQSATRHGLLVHAATCSTNAAAKLLKHDPSFSNMTNTDRQALKVTTLFAEHQPKCAATPDLPGPAFQTHDPQHRRWEEVNLVVVVVVEAVVVLLAAPPLSPAQYWCQLVQKA